LLRYWFAAVVAAAGFVGTYGLFVLTDTGQRWDDAALDGRAGVTPDELQTAEVGLSQITVTSLVVGISIVLLIALVRGRPLLGLGAAGLVAGSLFAAEVLKRIVLPRPELVREASAMTHNSFPSGHTTIAIAFMLALVLVVPYGLRPWAALAGGLWGVGISGYTIVAGWHRPSDTIGAAWLVVFVACAVTGFLMATGHSRVTRPRGMLGSLVRQLAVAPIALTAAVALGLGSLLSAVAAHQLSDPAVEMSTAEDNAYLGGRMLAVGSSAGAVLWLLVLLHRVDVGSEPALTLGDQPLAVNHLA
jgi:membrane-associated phospholipid phosphatase